MKQGDTITISGEFENITDIKSSGNYIVTAMIYCPEAKGAYKKLLFGNDYSAGSVPYSNFVGGRITLTNPNKYSFVIPASYTANMQGECQVEIGLTDVTNDSTAISDNYATFAIQNSVLGISLNG